MRSIYKILAIPFMVLILVFATACVQTPGQPAPAPAPTPEPAPAQTPTPTPIPSPQPLPAPVTEQGTIEFQVTDPPPADVASAIVYLNNIEVHLVSDNASGWITIIEDPPSFDLMQVKREVGDTLCIAGGMPVTLLQAGTPEEVRAETRKLIETVGRDGGYIMAANSVLDESDPELLRVWMEATQEYGVY